VFGNLMTFLGIICPFGANRTITSLITSFEHPFLWHPSFEEAHLESRLKLVVSRSRVSEVRSSRHHAVATKDFQLKLLTAIKQNN